MKKSHLLFTAIIALLILSSCSKKDDNLCATTEPPSDTITISIIDNEGNSLLGENNTYKPSEITLNRNNQNIPLRFYEYDGKTFMELYYYEMESEKDYALKLNDQETDILNLKLNTYNTECFKGLRSVVKFNLNGEEIQRDVNYAFIIQK
ncbi:MAG: hypothetical protein JJE55_02180 [Flavobacteriaceae bacterium]|nr:hypothetical protein [Flavobacteriaceae bacterium]